MRRWGFDVGHSFLAGKADGEVFADGGEEVLAVFASQAASAIVNARTHRAELRAWADLEAVVQNRWRNPSERKWSMPRTTCATFD